MKNKYLRYTRSVLCAVMMATIVSGCAQGKTAEVTETTIEPMEKEEVLSLLLVLCMMWALVGSNIPGGTANAADSPVTYTVEWSEQTDLFLGNMTAANGPITLRYTVAELTIVSSAIGNNGVMATTTPTSNYPYANGQMKYTSGSNQIVQTSPIYYELEIYQDSTTKEVTGTWTRTYATATGTVAINEKFTSSAGDKSEGCQYFGVYIGNKTTGKLTNVTCVDANGNDLGLQSNKACNIQKDAEPVKYTVEWSGVKDLFLGNKTATSGPITLRYTVEAIDPSTAIGNNGVMATTTPTSSYP